MAKTNNTLNDLLKIAEGERLELKHPYVGSEHLFLAIIKNNNPLTEYLNIYGVTYNLFKKELIDIVGNCKKSNPNNLYTPLLRKIIRRYEKIVNKSDILEEDIFVSMLDEGEGIAIRIMLKMDVDLDEIYFNLKEKRKIQNMEVSNKIGIFLNNYVNPSDKVIGREEEIRKIIMTLTRKKKCNPILVGPAGVGKTAIVEELTRLIIKNEVPEELNGYKIFMLEMGSLISGTKYRGEFEERLHKIINEILEEKKTIIFIDEIHSMVGAGGADGAINASDIFKPYLARGDLKLIGATTTKEYYNYISKDKALSRRFSIINVKEPSTNDMYDLINKVKKEYENFHNIKVSKQIAKKIVDLSVYYAPNIANPDRSIDLLDSSCSYVKVSKNHLNLSHDDVIKTIVQKTNNPVLDTASFSNKLKNQLQNIIYEKELSKLCSKFKFDSKKPISILVDSKDISSNILSLFNDSNLINVDISSMLTNEDTLYTNKSIEETTIKDIMNEPFSIINIMADSTISNFMLYEIKKMNEDGYILFKNNEKIYLNNVVIIFNYINKSKYNSGFSKMLNKNKLPEEFVNSFKCNLMNVKSKEISLV